jgi:hypothetical protein
LNYAGTFDATSARDGQSTHSQAYGHVDSFASHAPADAIVVPDAELLFHGDFKRAGSDLILSGDEREFVVHDYFKGAHHKALASVDGAHLTADLVHALTGEVEVSQADNSAQAGRVIGHCTKLVGNATVVRNGVSIVLNIGDNVEKGDVVQSASESTVGITFIDGTVFGLSANARMVLNEMVYDPNGSNNSSLMSLVAGTITFVAGETAKHGDMKIDTPVATMGIRGTAVLVEIDFNATSGSTDANFQVLVEPDGHTGSYILFDKLTLQPLAVVDTAALKYSFKDGLFSVGQSSLTQTQKDLIGDVFKQVFSDNSNPNSNTHATDSINPFLNGQQFGLLHGFTATIINATNTTNGGTSGQQTQSNFFGPLIGDPGAPTLTPAGIKFAANELLGKTADHGAIDSVGSTISYVDKSPNIPSATVAFDTATFKSNTPSQASSPLEKADIAALTSTDLLAVSFQQTGTGGTDSGVAGTFTWIYAVHDDAFDFLAQGETLTLLYNLTISNSYGPNPETSTVQLTITIVGTNDKPVITTAAPPVIDLSGGTSQSGGPLKILPASGPTHGTLDFTDVDLTDTHTVAVSLETPVLTDATGHVVEGYTVPPAPLALFEQALAASIAKGEDSTGTGFGQIDWTFTVPQAFNGDVIPLGDKLTLTYDVTVTDSFGATSTQTITVTIVGTDQTAVVWIATMTPGGTAGGFWSNPNNWETGTVPLATDDVIVVTNQLEGLTPSFPATIDSETSAVAHSLLMNDFNIGLKGAQPKLIVQGSLAVGDGGISLNADAVIDNQGSMSVTGAFNFHNQDPDGTPVGTAVTLTNSGTLVLSGGGEFTGPANVTNTGTFELSAGTLDVMVDITNFDPSHNGIFQIDHGATLALSGSTFTGGFINNHNAAGGGTIHVTLASKLVDLTLTGGAVTVDAKLTLDGTTVSGTTITVDSLAGSLELDNKVTLEGSAKIQGESDSSLGKVTNLGTLEIAGPASLLDVNLTNTGQTVQVDHNQTLTLSDTMITDGFINDHDSSGGGVIHVTGATAFVELALTGGAVTVDDQLTLDGLTAGLTVSGTAITVDSAGSVEIDNAVTLTGGATIQGQNGSTLGQITNFGTLEIAGPASLLDDNLSNGGHTVEVDFNQTLTLSGTTIYGGSIDDFNAHGGGFIHVTGASKFLDDLKLTGGVVTVDATLTLDGLADGLTVSGTTIKDNSDGSIEFDHTVKLTGGATIQGQDASTPGAITNLGTLEVSGAATLLDDTVTNANHTVHVDATTGTLNLETSTIDGGNLNVDGEVDSTGASFLTGVTIDNTSKIKVVSGTLTIDPSTFTNTGTIEVENGASLVITGETVDNTNGTIQVDGGGTLTLNGTTVTSGNINDFDKGGGGTIDIAGASDLVNVQLNKGTVNVDAKLTLDGTTVSATTINDNSDGSIEIDNAVKLTGGATIQGQNSSTLGQIANFGTLEIAGPASLINDNLSNGGHTVEVDFNQTLTLSGTTIFGGIIDDFDVNGGGFIHVTGASKLLDDLKLTGGTVTVDSKLTLDGLADGLMVSATTIKDNSDGSIELDNTVKLTGGATIEGQSSALPGAITNLGTLEVLGAATLFNDTLTNTSHFVQIDSTGALTLNGTTVTSGNINDFDKGGGGTIDIAGASDLVNVQLNKGTVNVDAKLTLDGTTVSATTIKDNGDGSIELDNAVTLTGGATIQGQNGSTLGQIANFGTLEIAGPASLLNDNLSNGGHTVEVDFNQTLTLSGTTIFGGVIDDFDVHGGGFIHVTGASKLLDDLKLIGGTVTVDSKLTLDGLADGLTVSGTTIKDNSDGSIEIDNTVKLTGGATIQGQDASTLGAITNLGTLEVSGTATLLDDTVTNANHTVHVDAATGTLNLEASTIKGGNLNVDGEVDSTGASFLTGVTIDNTSKIKVVSGTLTIDPSTFTNTGTVEVENGASLVLSDEIVTNTNGTIQVDGTDATHFATLDLINAVLNGGTLGGSGKILTAAGNTASTLNGVTLKSGTKVTSAAGVLNLTGTLTATGAEIDSNNGTGLAIDLESLTLLGGTLGGLGTIATASALNTFSGVSIANSTTVTVTDNTTLELKGTIADAGTIALGSSDHATQLEISGSVFLNGSGHVTLSDNTHNAIVSDGSAATLNNSDTIAGAGTIGDAHLTLFNSGLIEATGTHALIIDTGVDPVSGPVVGNLLVTNTSTGVLEAAPGHTLQIDDNVQNDGLIQAGSSGSNSAAVVHVTGNITGTGSIDLFNHATVEIGGSVSSGQTVNFESAGGGSLLILDDSHDFHGTITGLTEFSTESLENHVDLMDLAYRQGHMSTSYSNGLLTIKNGLDSVTLHVSPAQGMDPAFEFANDGSGHTLIDDPSPSGAMTIDSNQTLDISSAATGTVTFTNSNGNTGALVLGDSHEFTGTIAGFTGDGTPDNSDAIDLQDINFAKLTTETYTENASGTGGTLTLSDGTNTASLNFLGNYAPANFNFSSDGNGGTLLNEAPTTAPLVTPSSAVTDTVTANNGVDQFVFAPTPGSNPVQHTINNFNVTLDTINLQQFGNTIVSAADLIANHTTQVGSDTLIAIDSNDSVLLKNVQVANLHTSDFLVHV